MKAKTSFHLPAQVSSQQSSHYHSLELQFYKKKIIDAINSTHAKILQFRKQTHPSQDQDQFINFAYGTFSLNKIS